MAANAIKIDAERVARTLEEASGQLKDAPREVVLDFSGVQRIDPSALRALEGLANITNGAASTVALRGVNVDIYKVLTLAQLASRFSFLS
jgi:anti-anti-sigma regulatory factor